MALHHGVNALLVDDDMRTNQAHLARLEADGYAVALVTDPVVALALIEEVHPSVVFVGLTREVASLEFLHGLKSSRLSQHVPVVILAAYLATPQRGAQLRPVQREGW